MNVHPFIADSAADALTQIRARLGPDAVVLNVRKLPCNGLQALWQKPRIEVLACVPRGPAASAAPLLDALDERSADNGAANASRGSDTAGAPAASLDDRVSQPVAACAGDEQAPEPPLPLRNRFAMPRQTGEWENASLLRSMGLLPPDVDRVMERLRDAHGEKPPATLAEEWRLTRDTLAGMWRQEPLVARTHILVGPPGSGKTTALCKWLTQKVLLEGAVARVWRLNVPRANTAEALSVHCEILNVPLERTWGEACHGGDELALVDLPGVETKDAEGIEAIRHFLKAAATPAVTLVLNAAYDVKVLDAQVRAFSVLPVSHLLFTHLDEEPRWSKLWHFVLGTNYSISFLSAGQNIPGQFLQATPQLLFPPELRV